jgi:aspartate aminotransferase-like enzyme
LRFDTLRLPWGDAFDLRQVETIAARLPREGWLWCVHHETSTGMMNPLDGLKSLAARHGLRLCLDCVSSLGAMPVDLTGVDLAGGTSGKGLGSYPGLALVFHDYEPTTEPERLPGYLDLAHWATHGSVPHTHSSNLVGALSVALRAATPARMERIRDNAAWLRSVLRVEGCTLATPDALACPGIVTVKLAGRLGVATIGTALEQRGFLLNFRSSHLLARNWLQLSLLGDPPRLGLERFLVAFRSIRDRAAGGPGISGEGAPVPCKSSLSPPADPALVAATPAYRFSESDRNPRSWSTGRDEMAWSRC